MIAESGLQRSSADGLTDTLESALGLNNGGTEKRPESDFMDEDPSLAPEEHQDMVQLNAMLAETEGKIKDATKRGDIKEVNELRQRKEDITRLKRVEQIYVSLESTSLHYAV